MTRKPAALFPMALMLAAMLVIAAIAIAQSPQSPATPPLGATPATPAITDSLATAAPKPAVPAPPTSPVSGMRNKISAADLLSAESILEAYEAKNGKDGPWLYGLSWLARGALLLGEPDKARNYVTQVRARVADSLAMGVDLEEAQHVELALGAAIEVEAQLIERARGRAAAEKFVRAELAKFKRPVSLVSRLHKRLRMLGLSGNPAPELVAEDHVGDPPPSLASLQGKPVVLFVWSESCGDCKSQAPTVARAKARHAAEDVQWVVLTRYGEPDSLRAREKARMDSVWKAVFKDVGEVPIVISTASMEEYGGSSTPTYVFVDRKGIVRRYQPYRLTDAEFERSIAMITK